MTARQPFFSICIPAYNAEQHIYECLESIAAQDFDNWEVIVIDDASTDTTPTLVESQTLIPGDKFKCHLLKQNGGPYNARRKAFALAIGKIVLCLDSDDAFMRTDSLSILHQTFETNDCDLVLFNMSSNRSGVPSIVDYKTLFGVQKTVVHREELILKFSNTYSLNNLASKAIRRTLLLDNPIHIDRPLSMCEDRLEVLNVLLRTESATILDEPLYYYRPNSSSTTHLSFDIDFFFQKAMVESIVCSELERFGFAANEVCNFFLQTCAYDMCTAALETPMRNLPTVFEQMLSTPFLTQAIEKGSVHDLRPDIRLRIHLLMNGKHLQAALVCKLINIANRRSS